jgi:hypothetical protein
MYYLGVDDCIYNENDENLLCGVADFEVTADKKIYALTNQISNATATNDGLFYTDSVSLV